ncbi:MAG: hypothetical protein QM730_03990 [Anaerolineales bacterium]
MPITNATQTSQPTPAVTKTFIPTEDISNKKVSISSWNGISIISGAIDGELAELSYSYYVDISIDEAKNFYLDAMEKEGWTYANYASFESYRILLFFHRDNQNAEINLENSSSTEHNNLLSVSIEIKTLPFYSGIRSTEVATSKITLEGSFWLIVPGVDGGWPLSSPVELHQPNNQNPVFFEDSPWFKFEDIPAGNYELWVFIISDRLWETECYDIGLPDENWEFRRITEDNKMEVISGRSFREAVYPNSGTRLNGLYAVLDNIVLNEETENSILPAFICEKQ